MGSGKTHHLKEGRPPYIVAGRSGIGTCTSGVRTPAGLTGTGSTPVTPQEDAVTASSCHFSNCVGCRESAQPEVAQRRAPLSHLGRVPFLHSESSSETTLLVLIIGNSRSETCTRSSGSSAKHNDMDIEIGVGIGKFKLGVALEDPLWDTLGDHVPFKRNFLQKNAGLDFHDDHIIVYFDNDGCSAAIEVLKGEASIGGINLMGISSREAKRQIRLLDKEAKISGDVLEAPSIGLSFYLSRSTGRRIVASLLVFNQSYLLNNDLADYTL